VESFDVALVTRTCAWCPGRYPDRCLRPRGAVVAGEGHSANEAAVVCHRYLVVGTYLAVGPRPLPAAPFLVRSIYLIVVPRPLPAAPLAARRTYLAAVPRPVHRLV
jgi:hypothetical protein